MRDSCAESFQLMVCVAGVNVFVRVAREFHSYFRTHAAVSQRGGKTVSERVKAETGKCAPPVRFDVFPFNSGFFHDGLELAGQPVFAAGLFSRKRRKHWRLADAGIFSQS